MAPLLLGVGVGDLGMTPRGQLRRDTLVNVISVALRVLVLIWVIRLAGLQFSAIGLGLFLLARRISSTAACLLQLGVSQTLLRYVGQYASDGRMKRVFVGLAGAVWLLVAGIGTVAALTLGPVLAEWLFPGVQEGRQLALWTIGLGVATIASFLPYSVFLAERWVLAANALELMNAGGFLLLALAWYGAAATPVAVIAVHTIAMTVTSLGVLAWYVTRLKTPEAASRTQWRDAVTLAVRFGPPRGVSAFLDMLVLLVGPWLLRGQAEEAGYLIIALTLVRMLQTGIMPISQMGAITVARLAGAAADVRLREGVRLLAAGALYGTTLALAVLVPWLDRLLELWLPAPEVSAGVARYATIVVWGVLPYVLFQALKGVVEMRWVTPYNLYSLGTATGIQVVGTLALAPMVGMGTAACIGVLLAFVALGGLTVIWLRQYFGPVKDFALIRVLLVGSVLAAGNVALAAGGGALHVVGGVGWSCAVVGAFLFTFPPPMVQRMRAFLLASN